MANGNGGKRKVDIFAQDQNSLAGKMRLHRYLVEQGDLEGARLAMQGKYVPPKKKKKKNGN